MPSSDASADRNLIIVSVSAWAMHLVYLEMSSWGAYVRNEGMKGKKETNTSCVVKGDHHFDEQM